METKTSQLDDHNISHAKISNILQNDLQSAH